MADSDKVIKLKIELNKAQASANIEKLKNSLKKLDGRRKEARVIVRKLRLEEAKLSDLRAKSSKSISNHANELKNANKQTGAATSATLEFGRVLSDAPYGIRGVANNLQQLASNLFFMSRGTDAVTGKTIGFLGALGTLGKSLLGPAGILVLFQGLTALLDWYSNRTNEASKATLDFSNLIDKQAAKLMILKDILKNTNVSLEDKKKIASNVNNEFKDLNLTIDKQGKLTKTSQENIDKLTKSLVKNAKAQSVLKLIADSYSEIAEIQIERQKRISEGGVGAFKGTLEDLEEQRYKYRARALKQIMKSNLSQQQMVTARDNYEKGSTMKKFDALRDFRKKDIQNASERIKSLTKMIIGEDMFSIYEKANKNGAKDKSLTVRDPKDFDKEAEDYLEQIRNLAKKTELLNAKTQVEKIEIDRKHHIQNLKIKHEEDKEEFTQESEAYKAKLKLFLDYQVKTGKMSQAQANQELSDFDINVKSQLDTMDENFPTLLIRWQNYYTKKAEAAKIGEIGTMKPLKDEIKKEETEIEKFERFLARFKEIQGIITNFMNSEFDRQITIEQNKTNSLNNELNKRLLNENLSKDERERIQLQIGRNDEKLRKTQERIERKRFNLNKAANMATALLETYASAQKAYFNSLSNPANKLLPDGGMLKAKISAGVATAFGLLNVAAIGRQKFQSSAGSGGTIGASGGGGGGGEGREFNFNLAGSTQSNQLTQSIASQLNQPIQAYVVSSEITSQQQLDLNISNTATIG